MSEVCGFGGEFRKSVFETSNQDIESWQVIVDLVSGMSQQFERQVRKRYPDKTVLSIDPRLGFKLDLERDDLTDLEKSSIKEARESPTIGSIASIATSLPIKEGSVDALLALHSVPGYFSEDLDTFERQVISLTVEIARVVKKNGGGLLISNRFYR